MSIIQCGRLRVQFGALCAPIREQVNACGLKIGRGNVEHLQTCADAIVRLSVNRLLTEAEAHRSRQRLMKAIARAVSDGGGLMSKAAPLWRKA